MLKTIICRSSKQIFTVYSLSSLTRQKLIMNSIHSWNTSFTTMFSTTINPSHLDHFKDMRVLNLTEFKSKNHPGVKYVTQLIQQLFGLSADRVKELMKKCPRLKKTSCDLINQNYELCEEAGISPSILIKYPVLLTLEVLEAKIKYIEQLNVDINAIAPLLLLNIKPLKRIVDDAQMEENIVPYGNRIIYMSKLLDVSAPEVCEKIVNHSYVLRLPFDRLESILKVLLEYGVEPRNILNDCWALRYNSQIAEERLQKAIASNVVKVKTWMIRCQDKVFERCINRQIENRKILGTNASVDEYLSKRLECSIENAKYLTEKYPAINKMSILKMKEMLDFLYAEGYTPTHVCRVPRILIHSMETTKARMQQLKELGYVPPSLAILCKSKRDFDKIHKKLQKRKKNADLPPSSSSASGPKIDDIKVC